MAGNDFVKNPAGSAAGGPGANFITNPSGKGPTGEPPRNFLKGGAGDQKVGANTDLNPESEISQGGKLVPLADAPASRAGLVGVGSIGNASKPFKGI